MLSYLFVLGISETENPVQNIKYQSTVQILNKYSGAHISTTTELNDYTYEPQTVYTSSNSFENGFLWSVEQPHENISTANQYIECGMNITLYSIHSHNYLSIRSRKGNIYIDPTPQKLNVWNVECSKGPYWKQYDEFMLRNPSLGCYLSGSLEKRADTFDTYQIGCTNLTKYSVWEIDNGIFFGDVRNESFKQSELM